MWTTKIFLHFFPEIFLTYLQSLGLCFIKYLRCTCTYLHTDLYLTKCSCISIKSWPTTFYGSMVARQTTTFENDFSCPASVYGPLPGPQDHWPPPKCRTIAPPPPPPPPKKNVGVGLSYGPGHLRSPCRGQYRCMH